MLHEILKKEQELRGEDSWYCYYAQDLLKRVVGEKYIGAARNREEAERLAKIKEPASSEYYNSFFWRRMAYNQEIRDSIKLLR